MSLSVRDVVQIVEALAPSHLAETWDNVGLQTGRTDWPVRSIWVALDPSPDVMEAACQAGADLLVTHHPLIFKPLQHVDFSTPEGRVVQLSVQNQTAVFSAHTNLDSATEGLNDLLSRKIGLKRVSVLEPRSKPPQSGMGSNRTSDQPEGLGRIGELETEMTLARLAVHIKKTFNLTTLQVAGRLDLSVCKVAVCTGSGSGLMSAFLASAADVYVSGDLTYHNGRAVEAAERGLIDLGHFASEHLIVDDLARRIQQCLPPSEEPVVVTACTFEKDPFACI